MTERQFDAFTGKKAIRKNKYNAVACHVDGFRFDSKAEALYYKVLKHMAQQKYISYFLRQVPFHLPGNIRLVVDFVVLMPDGEVLVMDVKGGEPTYAWTLKRKTVEALYPVTISVVRKKEINAKARLYGVSL